MRKRELERFRKLLLQKREKVLEELGFSKGTRNSTMKDASGDLSLYSYHMADLGTDAMEREKTFYLASKSGRYLYHIDEALRRIDDGTYGKCHECGENIHPERLKEVPHARLCISCKEKEEQEKAPKR